MKKQTKTGISMGFLFEILLEAYIYNHEVVFLEIPGSKFMAKLARNTLFEGN